MLQYAHTIMLSVLTPWSMIFISSHIDQGFTSTKAMSTLGVAHRAAAPEGGPPPLCGTARQCISCNQDLLEDQWHTCYGCDKPMHGKVLADMSRGACVVTHHPDNDSHLLCKKCTEKLVDKNKTAKPVLATSTDTNVTSVKISNKTPSKVTPAPATAQTTAQTTAKTTAKTGKKSATAQLPSTVKVLKGKPATKDTPKEETGDGTGAVTTGPIKTDAEKLAELYTKHSIPIFPPGIEYDQLLDLKKLFSLQSYSSIATQHKMSTADLHFVLTDRYGNLVILYWHLTYLQPPCS